MINVTNNTESKEIDRILIEEYLIPEQILMENAARSLLDAIDTDKYKNIIVISGPGNNGGDGLALARLLHMKGLNVKIICPGNKTIHCEICKKLGIPFITHIEKCDLVIDAIFGVGITGEIKGLYREIIDEVNDNKDYEIYSIDLPSGNIKSDRVFMLSSYKEDMLNSTIPCEVLNIGVSPKVYEKVSNKFIVDEEFIKSIKKERDPFANKSDFGRLGIYAKNGAALLACKAAIKTGCGYTYLLSDALTKTQNLIFNPETINLNMNEDYNIKYQCISIGPALGVVETTKEIILKHIDKKLVLDADALTILGQNPEIIPKLNENCIITPHYLELSRITGENVDSLITYPFKALKRLKNDFRGCVLLKGKNTIIYDGKNYYIINIGNSKMANAGMGDTLTGIIGSYVAQGYTSLEACILGAYKHAYLGRKIGKTKDVVNPTDILNEM